MSNEPVIEEDDIEIIYTDDEGLWNAAKGLDSDEWENDPFSKNVEVQRDLEGLSRGMKRKLTNEINKRFTGEDGAKSKAKFREQLNGYDMYGVVPPLYNMEHLALLMEKSTVHHSAVMAKVHSSVSVGFDMAESERTLDKLEEANLDDDEDYLEFVRRKVSRMRRKYLDWVDAVNEEDTFTEILEKWITDYESMGSGYLEIGRKSDGSIGYIGHIPGHTMRPRKNRDGYVQIVDGEVTFFRNFGDVETSDPIGEDSNPNEIVCLKKYSPRSTYYGVPDIIPALTAVAGVEFAKQYNIDYFENKAVPRHLIVVKGARLSAASEKKLIQFFQTNVKGKHHRAVYIPIPEISSGVNAEIDIKPVEADIQDASFEKYINMGRDEILMAHRVPLTKVGLTADINLAVARDADRTFKESVSKPLQRKIERKINYILEEKTDVVRFALKELSLTDEETQSVIDETYLRNGVRSVNEVRAERGWKAVEGGDEYINVNDPAQEADERSQARGGRQREQDERRSGPDSNNSDQGREPKS